MTDTDDAAQETPLLRILRDEILRCGPLLLSEYIARCLTDERHGYYRRKLAIGAAGDFVTAPEISQIFGELIGLWAAVTWQQMGAPRRLRLIELGAGRGTLLSDMLRAGRKVPGFTEAATINIVEINAALQDIQRHTLAHAGCRIDWQETIGDVPSETPTILIANEFLDALPIDQWRWRDRRTEHAVVGLDGHGDLSFGWAAPCTPPPAEWEAHRLQGGTFLETRDTTTLVDELSRRSSRAPLAGLFIDYGQDAPSDKDTLQAVRQHRHESPLAAPGDADLTSQVDFAAFARTCAATGLGVDGPVPQGHFLGALGIMERASRLMAAAPGERGMIEAGIARLMSPTGMGVRFLAMGVRSSQLPPLAGF